MRRGRGESFGGREKEAANAKPRASKSRRKNVSSRMYNAFRILENETTKMGSKESYGGIAQGIKIGKGL